MENMKKNSEWNFRSKSYVWGKRKNTLGGINYGLDIAEENNSEFENLAIKTIHNKTKGEKGLKEMKRLLVSSGTTSRGLM